MRRFIELFLPRRCIGGCVVILLAAAAFVPRGADAHKVVTSKFGYNDDIFPIFRDRCGRCHVTGGPTPMSLLTYEDAIPWAESIRQELSSEQMPPWFVDAAGPAAKGGQPLSAREIDMIVTWAAGGTPQGDFSRKPAPVAAHAEWRGGEPDLLLPMASEHALAPDVLEETVDFTLATNFRDTKWITRADLLPGTPSLVRDAVISVENGPILSLWVPGNEPVGAPSGTAFKLPPGANIHVGIHYRKQWRDEQKALSDRSTIGIYFTDPPIGGREIRSIEVDDPSSTDSSTPRTFEKTLTASARIVAIRPTVDQPYGKVDVQAVTPSGGKVPLIVLSGPRPEWSRRYWLAAPVELPAGSRIEVAVAPPSIESDDAVQTKRRVLQVALDYVSR